MGGSGGWGERGSEKDGESEDGVRAGGAKRESSSVAR